MKCPTREGHEWSGNPSILGISPKLASDLVCYSNEREGEREGGLYIYNNNDNNNNHNNNDNNNNNNKNNNNNNNIYI